MAVEATLILVGGSIQAYCKTIALVLSNKRAIIRIATQQAEGDSPQIWHVTIS